MYYQDCINKNILIIYTLLYDHYLLPLLDNAIHARTHNPTAILFFGMKILHDPLVVHDQR